jgi:hypothetical protein
VDKNSPLWVRAGLIYLTVSFLVVGIWATADPSGFFDTFPGGDRSWIANDGPYNAHLMGDAGVGFLAVGVVLLLASAWMDRRVVQAALLAAVVHGVPHLLYHLRHPNEALSGADSLASNGGLGFGSLLALVLLIYVSRSERSRISMNRSGSSIPQKHETEKATTRKV